MDILGHFDHHGKKQNKEHFLNLIHVALADGSIDKSEIELLHKFGRKLGFTITEIDSLIDSATKSTFNPPYEFFKRFEQVYEIVKIVLADGMIDENEMRLANNFATKSGFSESEIPKLLDFLIKGIKEASDVDDLFEVYKKMRKV